MIVAPWGHAQTFALGLVAAAFAGGCNKDEFKEPMVLGGQTVTAATLNDGREAYMLNCFACHGDKGNGKGPSSPSLRPPPRDFTAGLFKFGGVSAGQLPTDEALSKLIKNGLAGTPMLPWDVSDRERMAIIQYVKTLSPKWKTEKPGEPIVATPDPWKGKEAEAIERGKRVYHFSGAEKDASGAIKGVFAGCNTCHPSYLTRAELAKLSQEVLGTTPTEFAPELYRSQLKPSEYGVQFLPIDFLYHEVKNGTTPEELYVSIAAGIGGTAMPTWKGTLGESDLWALVHYVKTLIDQRDRADGRSLRASLMMQPAYAPPPPPAAPAAPAGAPAAPAGSPGAGRAKPTKGG